MVQQAGVEDVCRAGFRSMSRADEGVGADVAEAVGEAAVKAVSGGAAAVVDVAEAGEGVEDVVGEERRGSTRIRKGIEQVWFEIPLSCLASVIRHNATRVCPCCYGAAMSEHAGCCRLLVCRTVCVASHPAQDKCTGLLCPLVVCLSFVNEHT